MSSTLKDRAPEAGFQGRVGIEHEMVSVAELESATHAPKARMSPSTPHREYVGPPPRYCPWFYELKARYFTLKFAREVLPLLSLDMTVSPLKKFMVVGSGNDPLSQPYQDCANPSQLTDHEDARGPAEVVHCLRPADWFQHQVSIA